MNVSSVSPERWLMIDAVAALGATRMQSSVSVSEPIWLSLMRIALAVPALDAAAQALDVGDEEIVADELHALAELCR